MPSSLSATLQGLAASTLIALNTLFWGLLISILAILKLVVPLRGFRRACTRVMVAMGETWIWLNQANFALTQNIRWDVQSWDGHKWTRDLTKLQRDRSYLIFSNHQSWVDILVLQQVFNRRVPFLRFFLKQQLLYVPLLGLVWWALDFPFMKRYSKDHLEKHPEKRNVDLETTRQACARFRGTPTSILNFLEGTRATARKRESAHSPYKHLLPPKSGGAAFVLDAMGDQFDAVLDVTIAYPEGATSFFGFLGGGLHEIVVRVRKLPIPSDLLRGQYLEDEAFRTRLQSWVRDIWMQKDELLSSLQP